jgi:hypothetical protein
VARRLPPVLLVLGTRPPGEPPPEEFDQMRGLPGAQALSLDALPPLLGEVSS